MPCTRTTTGALGGRAVAGTRACIRLPPTSVHSLLKTSVTRSQRTETSIAVRRSPTDKSSRQMRRSRAGIFLDLTHVTGIGFAASSPERELEGAIYAREADARAGARSQAEGQASHEPGRRVRSRGDASHPGGRARCAVDEAGHRDWPQQGPPCGGEAESTTQGHESQDATERRLCVACGAAEPPEALADTFACNRPRPEAGATRCGHP